MVRIDLSDGVGGGRDQVGGEIGWEAGWPQRIVTDILGILDPRGASIDQSQRDEPGDGRSPLSAALVSFEGCQRGEEWCVEQRGERVLTRRVAGPGRVGGVARKHGVQGVNDAMRAKGLGALEQQWLDGPPGRAYAGAAPVGRGGQVVIPTDNGSVLSAAVVHTMCGEPTVGLWQLAGAS